MLQELAIRNFAIIEDVRITFESGLTVLSGETGAGKSIILNAVNLLLGARASSDLIRTGADSAELEAFFEIAANSEAAGVLTSHDFDPSEGFIVRRVISRTNRHRVYLNGRMATTQALTEISSKLASIAGQHSQQLLLDENRHLDILDQYADLIPLRREVAELYKASGPMIRDLDKLKSRQQTQSKDIALLQHQIEEIEQAELSPNEDQSLEDELKRLRHGRHLLRTLQNSRDELYSRNGAVIERLQGVEKELQAAAQFDAALDEMAEILADCRYRIEEVAARFDSYTAGMDLDGQRLEALEERLDTIQKLKRKYGGGLAEVFAHLDMARGECQNLDSLNERITVLEIDLETMRQSLFAKAEALSESRHRSAVELAQAVERELATLSMDSTRLEVEMGYHPPRESASAYHISDGRLATATGLDHCRFMISPNVGEALRPLKAIASGGELSRIILAIKAILASTETVQTLIFDEVDAGIGGAVGEVVGGKLAQLARHHQVLCITHLPQIAVFGRCHYNISKTVQDGRTRAIIAPVNAQKRVEEVARMLGGIKITEATRKHARELLAGVNNESEL